MPFSLSRIIKAAALILLGAIGAGWPAGDNMAHAETQPIQLPWKGTDDEIVTNLAIGSLRDSLLMWLKTDRGVHAETLLVSIGALAGFAAQNSARIRVAQRDIPLPPGADKTIAGEALIRHLRESGLMLMMTTKSSEVFYFGDLINGYLVNQSTTTTSPLWSLVATQALQAGVKPTELPDFREMFTHVTKTIGTPDYGIPRAPKDHPTHLTPRQALDLFWPRAKFIFNRTDGPGPTPGRSVPPEYWPLATAIVASQFMQMSKDTLDPRIGLVLVMESAIAMSKVDPAKVPQTESGK